jgi:Rps23 Pro-64 3,4-dihydroxylase Tpa1-like proline 4-hydroxylase
MHRISWLSSTRRIQRIPWTIVTTQRWLSTITNDATSKSSETARAVASSLAHQLSSPTMLKHIQTYGFCIIDRVFSGTAATVMGGNPPSSSNNFRSPPCQSPISGRMRQEIFQLSNKGLMDPNHTHIVNAGGKRSFIPKQAIKETDFAARPELLEQSNLNANQTGSNNNISNNNSFSENSRTFWKELVHSSLPIEALNSQLHPNCTIDSMTVKAQLNEGNSGCFPLHFDTDARIDSRKLTAILYLNPSWQCRSTSTPPIEQHAAVAPSSNSNTATVHEADGGELRLYPFPHGSIDISPIDERLVLFDSSRMLHRVLPSARPRVCVSFWFWQNVHQWETQKSSALRAEDDPTFIAEQQTALKHIWPDGSEQMINAVQTLLSSKLRMHWSKLALRDAWFTSIEQSHIESDERQSMLVRHLDETDQIDRALTPLLQLIPDHGIHTSQSSALHADDDYLLPWQKCLPLPWSQPPSLPPFCSFTDDTPAANKTQYTTGNNATTTSTSRLVPWGE